MPLTSSPDHRFDVLGALILVAEQQQRLRPFGARQNVLVQSPSVGENVCDCPIPRHVRHVRAADVFGHIHCIESRIRGLLANRLDEVKIFVREETVFLVAGSRVRQDIFVLRLKRFDLLFDKAIKTLENQFGFVVSIESDSAFASSR